MELLKTENLKKHYEIKEGILGKSHTLRALDGVSITVEKNRVFAIVGESGSGKSTLARVVLRLTKPTGGRVFFKGKEVFSLKGEDLKAFRRAVQVVFQDPFASLNPRMSIFSTLSEPFKVHGLSSGRRLRDDVAQLLESVGLKAEHMDRYPHQFSGGQRQRICIARALALSPELIVADEPLSSLDVSIQAQILNLLTELKEKRELSYLFISHDLNVVHYFADRVAVMYAGKVVEEAGAEELFQRPLHPYTELLLDAVPKMRLSAGTQQRGHKRVTESVYPEDKPGSKGCSFLPRCPKQKGICATEEPLLKEHGDRKVACHLY